MKNIIIATLFSIVTLIASTSLTAQNRQQPSEAEQKEQNRQLLGIFVIEALKMLFGEEKPATKPVKKATIAEKAAAVENTEDYAFNCRGVWTWDDKLVMMDKYGNFTTYTSNYQTMLFSGTYKVSGSNFAIYDKEGNDNGQPLTLYFKGSKMYLIFPDKSYNTLTYLMTIKEFYAQKDKDVANMKANADRFVATQQGYVTSGQIRNSVNYADSRRSYNEELIKAKAQVKYFQGFNKNTLYATDIKRWEDKVYQIEQDIKRLDANAGN